MIGPSHDHRYDAGREPPSLDRLPVLVWATGVDAQGTYFNPAWGDFTGRREEELLSDGWLASVHANDRAAVAVAHKACHERNVGFELEYRLRGADGRYHQVLARGSHAPDHGAGACVAAAIDITARWRADAALSQRLARTNQENARLAALQSLTANLAALTEPNQVAEVVLGQGVTELGATTASLCLLCDDGETFEVAAHVGYPDEVTDCWGRFPAASLTPAGDVLRERSGIYISTLAELYRRYPIFEQDAVVGDQALAVLPLVTATTGPLGAMVFGFARSRQFPAADRRLLDALAAQAATALARARARVALERARGQLAFLAAASERLAGSLDLEETLATVADLAVPRLADRCWISLARSDEHLEAIRQAGFGAAVVHPLRARGQLFGALALANRAGHSMADQDRVLAEELAARAAVAIDNARLYADQVTLAQRLQASLLPPSLPAIDGLDLAARYAPAGDGAEVGGDFYDCIRLSRTRLLLVMGDVKGKGVDAAVLTGMARHSIRAVAGSDRGPADILAALNRALYRQEAERMPEVMADAPWEDTEPRFCTILAVSLTRRGHHFHAAVASAGHPLPLLRYADGRVTSVGRAGTMLGILPRVELPEVTVTLDPGMLLVCYTDGVSERHDGPRFFGEEGITAVLAGAAGAAHEAACAIERAARSFPSQGEVRDDMAILAVGITRDDKTRTSNKKAPKRLD